MNNKGFSLIEIMSTFLLLSVILVLLVELLLSLKSMYKEGDLKTTLYINQANMEKQIYSDIFNNRNISLASCGINCVTITTDNTTKQLKIINNSITYDNYAMKLTSGSKIGELTYDTTTQIVNGKPINLYKIDIPVTNKLVSGDFGIHIIAQTGNELY